MSLQSWYEKTDLRIRPIHVDGQSITHFTSHNRRAHISCKTGDIEQMLDYCWAAVADSGPTLIRHRVKISPGKFDSGSANIKRASNASHGSESGRGWARTSANDRRSVAVLRDALSAGRQGWPSPGQPPRPRDPLSGMRGIPVVKRDSVAAYWVCMRNSPAGTRTRPSVGSTPGHRF